LPWTLMSAEELALFADDALRSPPDTRCLYSTFGHTLVAAAIEGATGRTYAEVLARELITPLGLIATALDDNRVAHSLRDSPRFEYAGRHHRVRGHE